MQEALNNFEVSIALSTPTLTRVHRGFEDYRRDLLLDDVELNRKRILDHGAGLTTFAVDLEGKYSKDQKPEIILFDSCYTLGKATLGEQIGLEIKMSELKDKYPEVFSRAVGGLFSKLPFRDESFDLVLSYNSLMYQSGRPLFKQCLKEIVRVLKRGGEARIAPFEFFNRNSSMLLIPFPFEENEKFYWSILNELKHDFGSLEFGIFDTGIGKIVPEDLGFKGLAIKKLK